MYAWPEHQHYEIVESIANLELASGYPGQVGGNALMPRMQEIVHAPVPDGMFSLRKVFEILCTTS